MRIAWVVVASSLGTACIATTHSVDSGFDAGFDSGSPLSTPLNEWTWVPFPGSACGNGTPAGIVVNRSEASADLAVFFSGGGLCATYESCKGSTPFSVHTQDTLEPDGSVPLIEARVFDVVGLSDRRNPTNPFRAASFVYVPYCTGDLHTGTREVVYAASDGGTDTMHYVGARNVEAFLSRLKDTVKNPSQIWLIGTSAGGFGAMFNVDRVRAAFPQSRLDVLADAAPFLTPDGGRWAVWQDAWRPEWPATCADCDKHLPSYVDDVASRHPDTRFGLLVYRNDWIISAYWGHPTASLPVPALLSQTYDAHANTRYFSVPGLLHGFLTPEDYNDRLTDGGVNTMQKRSVDGGITVREWVSIWARHDAGWSSVR